MWRNSCVYLQQEGDPDITDLARDLGVDSSAARMRRVAKARVKGSITPAGLYGHQCQGVAPRHMTWLRIMVAGALGCQKLGASDTIFDMRSHKCQDPSLELK